MVSRELANEVRDLNAALEDLRRLQESDRRTKIWLRTLTVGSIVVVTLVAIGVYATLLGKVNVLLDEQTKSLRTACESRNNSARSLAEHYRVIAGAVDDRTIKREMTALADEQTAAASVDCARRYPTPRADTSPTRQGS